MLYSIAILILYYRPHLTFPSLSLLTLFQEYIIKGVVHATIGQSTGSRDHLKIAQQCFQLVGTSAHECDTIPGRQCMASCFYLMRQFEDVNIYLNSIKAYM